MNNQLSLPPHLCPQCYQAGVVAAKNGPTCRHVEPHGVKWWPAEFPALSEEKRVEWLKTQNEK